MKNYLLLGGNGFLGKNITELLIKQRKNVFIMDTMKTNKFEKVKEYEGKLTEIELIKKIILENSIEVVVHLISSLHTSDNYEKFRNEIEEIINPTYELIEFLKSNKIKFIYLSSGGTVYNRGENLFKKESETTNPLTYYGYSKKLIEDYILFNKQKGLEYLILRISNPYGKYQNIYGNQGVIGIFINKILNNEKIEVYGDGENIRDYIYIDDFKDIFQGLIDFHIKNEIINIGSGEGTSLNMILNILKKTICKEMNIEYLPTRKTDIKSIILDINKLKSILPNKRFISIDKGIKNFYKEIKKMKNES